jgi:hypothetical protein
MKYEKPEVALLATAIDAVRGGAKLGPQFDSMTEPFLCLPRGVITAYESDD